MKNIITKYEDFVNENKNTDDDISIFDYVEENEKDGYAVALYNADDELVEDYVDPSDYPSIYVDKKGNVTEPKEYVNYTVGIHTGGLVDNKDIKKTKGFRSKYD
jgi:hypothetical protein